MSAVVLVQVLRIRVDFDKPLVAAALSPANWRAVLPGPVQHTPLTATVIAPNTRVRLDFAVSMSDASTVTYLASPPELIGEPPNDVEVAPFTLPVL